MKRTILALAAASLVTAVLAFPVRIQSWQPGADVKRLNQLKVSVDYVNPSSGAIIAYVHDEQEFQSLLDQGFPAVKLPDEARDYAQKLSRIKASDPPRDEYFTNDQYNQFMVDTAAQFPAICSLVQAGTSIQGRPIYFLKITDNPALEEAEPEFKYISSIHGDEVVGYYLCIKLIQQLTSEYGTNPRITNLVDNTEIWICPMMNPDGYVLGQRYNAAGVDLNRNFPMPTGEQHPDGNATAPENLAVMDFSNAHSFNLSANFHGGALVFNYPWDYTLSLAPDNDLLIQSALAYTTTNLPMYNSTEFPQGITNGAAWYIITGSMQDWCYGFTDCIESTIELGNTKWPQASTLPTYWAQNQESLLAYMEFAQRGAQGYVTTEGGAPLAASIIVEGNAKTVNTDPSLGDYHRLLLPGTHTLTAMAPGYLPQTAQITVPATGAATHNFALTQAQAVDFNGQIRHVDGVPIPSCPVTIHTDPPLSTVADVFGCFSFPGILEGLYDITFNSALFEPYSTRFLLTADEPRQVFILLETLDVFSDPCDNLANWTVTGPWGVVESGGNNVITDSPAGNYNNNSSRTLKQTTPVAVANLSEPALSFKTRYSLESGYDFVNVQASANGSDWTTLAALTGSHPDWARLTLPLPAGMGPNVQVRFRLVSDWSSTDDGIYLDDITISGIDAATVIHADADGNRRVNRSDIQAILDYSIGLDPLPETDPSPWDAARIAACDVDEDLNLTALDARLAMRYLLEPGFRFEAQSGEEAVFDAVDMISTHNQQTYTFAFDPSTALQSLSFEFHPINGVEMLVNEWFAVGGEPFCSINPDQNKLAWIRSEASLNSLTLSLLTALDTVDLMYSVNGFEGYLPLHPTVVGNEDPAIPVPVFGLRQNHPNPFNPSTAIRFSLDWAERTTLRIFNTKGQLVKTLVDAELAAGPHSAVWDGRDENGSPLGSGIYFYRLKSGARSETRRMVMIK